MVAAAAADVVDCIVESCQRRMPAAADCSRGRDCTPRGGCDRPHSSNKLYSQ